MSSSRMWKTGAAVVLCAALAASSAAWNQAQSDTAHSSNHGRARIAFTHALPKLDGDQLKATLVEVDYGPGESSPPHSHPCAVIGYVVSGAIRTQVKGESLAVYKAGESFYEAPYGVHLVSGNASQTQPAKLLAYFVCDRDAPLSTAVPEATPTGGK
jgi:quercetin dioxygenase-like cupin family protein